MKSFCPFCEKTTLATVVDAAVPHTIKGVEFAVDAKLVRCGECGAEFNSPELDQDIAEMALRAYEVLCREAENQATADGEINS